jgi:hypothetical protein
MVDGLSTDEEIPAEEPRVAKKIASWRSRRGGDTASGRRAEHVFHHYPATLRSVAFVDGSIDTGTIVKVSMEPSTKAPDLGVAEKIASWRSRR